MPSSVPSSDETINCLGEGGIAENVGAIDRIDSVQAARLHKSTAIIAAVEIRPCRRAGDENAGGDCERDESLLSVHGGLLLCCRLGLRRFGLQACSIVDVAIV